MAVSAAQLFGHPRITTGGQSTAAVCTIEGRKANPLLRLSGITRVEDGRLRVRNRIYKRVFDREWAQANMPDAELRRLREAYLPGSASKAIAPQRVDLRKRQ